MQNNIIYQWNNKLISQKLPDLCPFIKVKRVARNHPAYPGKGLFATADLAAGTELGYYGGVYKHLELGDTNPYVWGVGGPGPDNFIIDGLHNGNELKYVNDPRRIGVANVKAKDFEFRFGRHR